MYLHFLFFFYIRSEYFLSIKYLICKNGNFSINKNVKFDLFGRVGTDKNGHDDIADLIVVILVAYKYKNKLKNMICDDPLLL